MKYPWDSDEFEVSELVDKYMKSTLEENKGEALKQETVLLPVHTACKECCFAIYKDKTQVGCSIGRLGVYSQQGCVIEAMDDEKEFYIVNGRVCGGFRTKPWFESHENPAEQIRKELSTKVDILIVLEDDMSFAYLNSTFKSICNQSLAANSVHVVNNQKDVKVSEVHSWLVANTPKDLSWSLTNVLERKSDKSLVSTERALDIAVPKLKGFVYAVFRPGYVIPSNFCLDIDQSLRVLIGRWSVLRPDYHDNGLVVHRGFHMNSLINGNSPMPAGTDSEPFLLNSIVEKADYIAKTEDMPWLIEDVRTICREM